MDACVMGDTGVALMTSGKGNLYAVNLTNPDQVKVGCWPRCKPPTKHPWSPSPLTPSPPSQ